MAMSPRWQMMSERTAEATSLTGASRWRMAAIQSARVAAIGIAYQRETTADELFLSGFFLRVVHLLVNRSA